MGLVSPGGVHAMQDHIAAVGNAVAAAGVPVVVHAFTDGRDVPPRDAASTLPAFLEAIGEGGGITVGTVTGRYWAMDRDNRWERVGRALDVIVHGASGAMNAVAAAGGAGAAASPVVATVEASYAADVGDEFVEPTAMPGYGGMKDGDGILMCNFRADRAREILTALAAPSPPEELGIAPGPPGLDGVVRPARPALADVCGMVQYSDGHNAYMSTLFDPKDIRNTLGEVVARAGLRQLRAAETEKYPHVTFFFNGGREEPFDGEDRILVPSPKVATYDLQPEMSAPELGAQVKAAIESGEHQLVVINFANPDMVGHTGDLGAAIKACEAVDEALAGIVEATEGRRGAIVVTADHGNCEKMWEEATDEPHTAHTLNKVPVILADYSGSSSSSSSSGSAGGGHKLRSGRLADLAPTVLQLLGVAQPPEMTGESLIIADPVAFLGPDLQDGPRLTRPPRQGNVDAGTVP